MFLLSLVEKRHLNRLDIPRFYLEHLFVSFFAHYFPGAWLRRERGGWMGMCCRTTRTQVYFSLAAKLMESPVWLFLDHAAQDKTSLSWGRSGPEEDIWCSGLPPTLWLTKLPAGETQALSCNKYTKSVDHNVLFLYGLKDKALQYYYWYLTQHDRIYWPKDCFFLINNDQMIYRVLSLHFTAIRGINTLFVLVEIQEEHFMHNVFTSVKDKPVCIAGKQSETIASFRFFNDSVRAVLCLVNPEFWELLHIRRVKSQHKDLWLSLLT